MKDNASSVMPVETRWAAIMFTGIVGFNRQMGVDKAHMLRLLQTYNQVIQQAVAEHHGTWSVGAFSEISYGSNIGSLRIHDFFDNAIVVFGC